MKIVPGTSTFTLSEQHKRMAFICGVGLMLGLVIYVGGKIFLEPDVPTTGGVKHDDTVMPSPKKPDDTKLYRSRIDNRFNQVSEDVERVDKWQFEHGKQFTEFRTKSKSDVESIQADLVAIKSLLETQSQMPAIMPNAEVNTDPQLSTQSPKVNEYRASVPQNTYSEGGGETFPMQGHLQPPQTFKPTETANLTEVVQPKFSHSLKLKTKVSKRKKHGEYLPRGSYIDAYVVSGVDASVVTESQQQPLPALLRITDFAQLPNHANYDFVDCKVLGAAHGDNSSSRVYIRTVSLACTLNNGEILDRDISAYIAGPDSKVGVRGIKVTNEMDVLANAGLSSMFSAGGQIIDQAAGTSSISPLGTTKTFDSKGAFKQVLGAGASETGNQMSKYFIDRAKSYEPVIELPGGTPVTLVLTEGFSFDENNQQKLLLSGIEQLQEKKS